MQLSRVQHYIRQVGFAAVLVFGLVYAGLSPAKAGDFQSLASIRLQAEAFILQYGYESPYPPGFQLGRLDSRLRLKACSEPLNIDFARPNQVMGNTTLLVRCPKKAAWKIHLPVRIDVFDDVAIAAKSLVKGQKIDETSVRFEKRNVARLKNGYYVDTAALTELQARRSLAGGIVLTPTNLSPRLLVRSGQRVTLVLNYQGLEIKTTGKALQSASLGQTVRVRNSRSSKIVEGVVSGEGLVKVSI